MFIIKERYLEVPNFQNWTEGLYLVDAPCGTGKSYFVFHTLYPFAKENNKKLIVFSNRNALKRQQELQAEGTDIELITYQKLEYNQYLNGDWNVRRSVPDLMQELEGYDYIVLDEAHYLFQDARFNRNTEVILSMIERYRLSKVIIMLSATPDLLKSYFGDRIKETYEAEADYSYIQKAYCYTSKDAAYKILDSIPQNEKAVFFGDSRERLKELHRRYSDSAYLCSDNETTSDVFEQITSTERFACRFLFTTKVLDNGVNLTDRTIKHIIIEQTDLIDFIQCLGRKRVQDEEDKEEILEGVDDAVSTLERMISEEGVEELLSTLTDLQRKVVHVHLFHGLSFTEAAKHLGMTRQNLTGIYNAAIYKIQKKHFRAKMSRPIRKHAELGGSKIF